MRLRVGERPLSDVGFIPVLHSDIPYHISYREDGPWRDVMIPVACLPFLPRRLHGGGAVDTWLTRFMKVAARACAS
jgi:hypothetical protein